MGKMRRSNHYNALEFIAYHPHVFGFKGVIRADIESALFDVSERLLAQADVIFECRGGYVCIIEYKSNGTRAELDRAREQLANAARWYVRFRGINPDTRIITGAEVVNSKRETFSLSLPKCIEILKNILNLAKIWQN